MTKKVLIISAFNVTQFNFDLKIHILYIDFDIDISRLK